MKKWILLVLANFLVHTFYGQVNIVKNPSFENYRSCPDQLNEIALAYYWNGIDSIWIPGSTDTTGFSMSRYLPDFVNKCGANGDVSVPNNYDFYHNPRTGNGMVQQQMFYDYYWGPSVGVDYLQGHLYHPLVAGQSYCVTFYVVLERHTGYVINHIAAYLDNGTIDTTTRNLRYQSEYTPQVVDTSVIYDTSNWTKIQGSFIATGTETFITLGVFADTGATRHVHYIEPGGPIALYLVDDVSVIATGTPAYAGRDTTIHAGDSTYIGIDSNGEGMPCLWYTLGEPMPIDSGGRIRVHPAGTTTYIVAMDLCGSITYDTVVVTVADVGMNKLNEQFLHIYPNPAKDNFTIEGAIGCEVRLYNVVGQSFDKLRMTNDRLRMTSNKEIVDISGLIKGVYIVEVCDKETGMRVSRRVVKE